MRAGNPLKPFDFFSSNWIAQPQTILLFFTVLDSETLHIFYVFFLVLIKF